MDAKNGNLFTSSWYFPFHHLWLTCQFSLSGLCLSFLIYSVFLFFSVNYKIWDKRIWPGFSNFLERKTTTGSTTILHIWRSFCSFCFLKHSLHLLTSHYSIGDMQFPCGSYFPAQPYCLTFISGEWHFSWYGIQNLWFMEIQGLLFKLELGL